MELELAEPADQGAEMADQERLPLAGSPQRFHAPRRHDHVGDDRQGGEDHAAGQAPRRQPARIDQAGDHDRDVDAEVREPDHGVGDQGDVIGQRRQQGRAVDRLERPQGQHQRATDEVQAELRDRPLSRP